MSVTYQLHLMLNAEQLMLGVDAAVGAIRKLSHVLEARDEELIVLGHLIDKGTLVVGSREWKDALVLGRGSTRVKRGLAIVGDGDLARVVATVQARRTSVAGKLR